MDIQEITLAVERENATLRQITAEIEKVVVGQKDLIEKLLVGLLCEGHLLLEGLPGLAKTTAVKALAGALNTSFQRIQFTPDLLPADILGTQIYRPDSHSFEIKQGPIFNNIILADEINRAPAKVQSALLEAMQERQVTIGTTTFALARPFLVLATQNPIEQEGTYPLPEAQVDRFMLKLKLDYPTLEEEREIVERVLSGATEQTLAPVGIARLDEARGAMRAIHMEDKLASYIVRIVDATRHPEAYGLKLKQLIGFGASPRGSIWLNQAARAQAFLKGRGYVTPQDVKAMAPDVLRHRILLTYEAEADGITADEIIASILETVEVP